jgi:hypothetical protein
MDDYREKGMVAGLQPAVLAVVAMRRLMQVSIAVAQSISSEEGFCQDLGRPKSG